MSDRYAGMPATAEELAAFVRRIVREELAEREPHSTHEMQPHIGPRLAAGDAIKEQIERYYRELQRADCNRAKLRPGGRY